MEKRKGDHLQCKSAALMPKVGGKWQPKLQNCIMDQKKQLFGSILFDIFLSSCHPGQPIRMQERVTTLERFSGSLIFLIPPWFRYLHQKWFQFCRQEVRLNCVGVFTKQNIAADSIFTSLLQAESSLLKTCCNWIKQTVQ